MQIKLAPKLVNAKIAKIMDKIMVSEKTRTNRQLQLLIIFFIH